MADDRHKKPPAATPFVAGDDDWESELAAWDAAIPIVTPATVGPPPAAATRSAPDLSGVAPDDENPFFETPTTVVSPAQMLDLDDLPDVIPAGDFDDGAAAASGSYAALITTDASAPGLFEREPAPEEAPPFPGDSPPEMEAAMWTGDLSAMVSFGDSALPVAAPDPRYLETLAQVLADERSLERERERAVALGLAGARLADTLGRPEAAREQLDAVLALDGTSVAAHRARLTLAERTGHIDEPAAAESLARLALMPHPDQAYYRALRVEWILARASRGIADGTAAAMITSAPDGLGRILAEAELAWREPTVAAALLEAAADRLGGGLGAALLGCAAGLNEVAHDFSAAAEQRFLAARLDDQRSEAVLGLIRDLARLDAEAVVTALEDMVTRLPPSSLKAALARWGAFAARRAGDNDRAWRFIADPALLDVAPPSAALARDRLDLWSGAPPLALADLLAPVAAAWPTAAPRVCLALRACELAIDGNGIEAALAAVEQVVADVPDAAALGPAVESLAARAPESRTRLRALRLWRGIDPARWAPASFELAEALMGEPVPLAAEGSAGEVAPAELVWGEIEAAAVTSTVFWRLAALQAGRGDIAGATAHLDRAVDGAPFGAGGLAGPLAELAAELTGRADVAASATRLQSWRGRGAAHTPGARLALERALRRLGAGELWAAFMEEELSQGDPPGNVARQRRAALLLQPAFWPREGGAGGQAPQLVSSALELCPLEPTAFGLMLAAGPPPAMLVDALVAGAHGGANGRWRFTAAVAAWVAGDAPRALSLALDLCRVDEQPGRDTAGPAAGPAGAPDEVKTAAAALVRRLAWTAGDSEQRAAVLGALEVVGVRADAFIQAAEALEAVGDQAAARRLFAAAAAAPGAAAVVADIEWGLSRLSAEVAAGGATAESDRLVSLEELVRAGAWDGVVSRLIEAPPHEEAASSVTFSLAADIDEGRSGGARAADLWSRARLALAAEAQGPEGAAFAESATEPPPLVRAADAADAEPLVVAAALEGLAEVVARVPDHRSAALYLTESARLTLVAGRDAPSGMAGDDDDTAAAGPRAVERRLRAAVRQDPASAVANIAWRRWLIQAGRLDEAATVAAAEAEALVDPTLRVQALLRAAAMLSASVGVEDWVARAADCLRRALAIEPNNYEAFTRLRDLYEESARHAELVEMLGARLAAVTNPFEVTALRLARAEVFAGPLADRGRAKAELDAILQKEPQHARALSRLAELEQDDGNDAGAADILIRLAFAERSPEKLRELFLRLGRIYTQRSPDAKRAVSAYTRVLQLDVDNREALDELSRLYLGLGETKSAISITERLVRIETVPERRAEYHVRLGHLAERGGDPRAASQHFHRAVEQSPRDIEALGELVRHLEKARDTAGRRALLDRAAGDLRAAVTATPDDAALLEAFVAVSRWRGRNATAAAVAELMTLLAADGGPLVGEPGRLPDWATPPRSGRRLAALTKPSVDEQTFGAVVPSSVRHLFRLLGPVLNEGGRSDLSAYRLERGDRVPAGRSPRDVFDAVAGELAAGSFDVYVVPERAGGGAPTLVVEPGKPATILIGAALVKLGPQAIRFIAARTLRLVSTHLDVAVAGSDVDLGAWLGGVIRQFVVDYRHPHVPAEVTAARAARVARLLPRKLRQEVMPFAMESSGRLDLSLVRAGILDGVNRVGLVASGSLAAALRVLLAIAGSGPAALSAEAIGRHPEAMSLLTFALSDEHDDLVRSLE